MAVQDYIVPEISVADYEPNSLAAGSKGGGITIEEGEPLDAEWV